VVSVGSRSVSGNKKSRRLDQERQERGPSEMPGRMFRDLTILGTRAGRA
jgi:hypothetical protein